MNRNRFKHGSDYKKDWLDWWLSDDPSPESVEFKLSHAQPPAYYEDEVEPAGPLPPTDGVPVDEPGATYITVNVNVPKIKPPDLKKLDYRRLRALPLRNISLLSGFAVVMLLAGMAAHNFFSSSSPQVAGSIGDSHQVLAANKTVSTKASFTPVAPKSKPELGAYAADVTHYDSSRDEYSYLDTMQGDQFTVSQQVLPAKYSSGQDAVDKVSASLAAKEPIVTASGIAYMKTESSSGKQVIVLTLKGLIIFIQSGATHTTADWANYIATLR